MFLDYFLTYNRYLNIVGVVVILGIAWLFSQKRSHINYRLVLNALLLQLVIGFCMLRLSAGQYIVGGIAAGVTALYQFADSGSGFVFGALVDQSGPWGFIFAFKVLSVIIFFGALMSLLFHLGIVQRVVALMNMVVQPILGTSGAETLCAVSNSFLGQTEAPLLVRHYLKDMTKSEMLVVMVSGMATISGAILAVFAAMGVPAQHLLTASVMAIPASLLISKILLPETEKSKTMGGNASVSVKATTTNVFDAIATGTSDGLQLALNVAAMLIAFLALLALVNSLLFHAGNLLFAGKVTLSIGLIFSYLFAPFGFLLGFSGSEIFSAGQLLGTKVAVNELIAYSELVSMHLSPRAVDILTYALCGFSNFSCIGIQIGGIGALVPEKREWLTQLGLYAVLGGALSNLLSAMIASLLL